MSKELPDILERVRDLEDKSSTVLATVVSLEGSGYRLPGARMLIARDGTVIGAVSGGCLEADLLERAQEVFSRGTPTVVTYDTRTNDDSVFSLNMGCNGVLRILIEPVEGNDLFAIVEDVFRTRTPVTLATVIASADPAHPVGERFIAASHGTHLDSLDLFIEDIRPPLSLVVFGAGFDAVPVVRLAKEVGWLVTVVDHRPSYLSAERLSYPDELLNLRPEEVAANLQLDADTAAVVMTHNLEHDREILAFLLKQDLRYIGCLGPRKRTERMLADVGADPDALARLHAPIGLDIGAQTPESIALSIIAEIQCVIAGREGGSLKGRNAPIYDRSAKNATTTKAASS